MHDDLFITPDVIIPLPEAKDYVERKEIKRQEQKQPTTTRSSFSMEEGDFDSHTLEEKFRATLARQSDLTPRFVHFLEILLSENRVFGREEVKQKLFKQGIGSDFSQTGRYLSNGNYLLDADSYDTYARRVPYSLTPYR